MSEISTGGLQAGTAAASRVPALVFTLTLVLSAALLFVVQPMFAKMVLPTFGGVPGVWNTAMVCFQAALLLGYLYAHGVTAFVPLRARLALHVAVLAGTLLLLPIGLPADWNGSDQSVVVSLIGAMVVAVGLPFTVMSATAPLLQAWYAESRRDSDPYFLYAASNVGSLASLVAYPFLIEPWLGVDAQKAAWSAGFVVLSGAICLCALLAWTGASTQQDAKELAGRATRAIEPAAPLTMGVRVRWLALAFVPSSLLLGVTTHVTTDIAAVPLLWIPPLTLYLLTFIISFSGVQSALHPLILRVTPYVVAVYLMMTAFTTIDLFVAVGVNFLLLFVLSLMCHGELSRTRPAPARLTEFFLLISAGGVLGGAFNALVAPFVFSGIYEYPIAVAMACFLFPSMQKETSRWSSLVFGAVILALAVAVIVIARQTNIGLVMAGICILTIVVFGSYRVTSRFAMGVSALLAASTVANTLDPKLVEQSRSFFGMQVVRKDVTGQFYTLRHGSTTHGAQFIDPARALEPLTYYSWRGPVGQVMAALETRGDVRRVASVGLGTGSVACYAKASEVWSFFEIDPSMVDLAVSGRTFTYMPRCAPNARMVVGDARLTLAHEPPGIDLLILDAFSSDAIPTHLLTKQAFEMYRAKLSERGVMLLHISNRYLHVAPVVGNAAAAVDMGAVQQFHNPTAEERDRHITPSHWVVLSRDRAFLDSLKADSRWADLKADAARPLWTDDYSNIVDILIHKQAN